jgi:hypothetical protein
MIGKLVGKAIGNVVALPATVAAEAVEAAAIAIDTAGKAIDKAAAKATEPCS